MAALHVNNQVSQSAFGFVVDESRVCYTFDETKQKKMGAFAPHMYVTAQNIACFEKSDFEIYSWPIRCCPTISPKPVLRRGSRSTRI